MTASLKPSVVSPPMSLWKLEIHGPRMTELVQMSRFHCKLVLEHSQSQTSPERRKAIKAEITAIRAWSDWLIADLQKRIHIGNEYEVRQFFVFNNHELVRWFDETREEILTIFSDVCDGVGFKWESRFRKNRKYW